MLTPIATLALARRYADGGRVRRRRYADGGEPGAEVDGAPSASDLVERWFGPTASASAPFASGPPTPAPTPGSAMGPLAPPRTLYPEQLNTLFTRPSQDMVARPLMPQSLLEEQDQQGANAGLAGAYRTLFSLSPVNVAQDSLQALRFGDYVGAGIGLASVLPPFAMASPARLARRVQFTPEMADTVRQLYEANTPIRHIAQQIGVSEAPLRRYMAEAGFAPRAEPYVRVDQQIELTPETGNLVRQLYEANVPLLQIADRAGISRPVLMRYLAEAQIAPRPPLRGGGPPRVQFTPEMQDAVRQLYAANLPLDEIAERVGVSQTVLARHIAEAGLPARFQPRPPEVVDRIAGMRRSGMSPSQIASELGLTAVEVSNILGRFARREGETFQRLADFNTSRLRAMSQAADLRRQGMSFGQIASQLGLTRSQVAGMIRDARARGEIVPSLLLGLGVATGAMGEIPGG